MTNDDALADKCELTAIENRPENIAISGGGTDAIDVIGQVFLLLGSGSARERREIDAFDRIFGFAASAGDGTYGGSTVGDGRVHQAKGLRNADFVIDHTVGVGPGEEEVHELVAWPHARTFTLPLGSLRSSSLNASHLSERIVQLLRRHHFHRHVAEKFLVALVAADLTGPLIRLRQADGFDQVFQVVATGGGDVLSERI